MGTSWLYEAGTSALQAGALTDFSRSWKALLHLSTAVRGSLFVGLDNYAFAAFEATTYVSSPKSLLAHPPQGRSGSHGTALPYRSPVRRVRLRSRRPVFQLESGLGVLKEGASSSRGQRSRWILSFLEVQGECQHL